MSYMQYINKTCFVYDYVYCIYVIWLKCVYMMIYPNIHLIYILMIHYYCFNHFFSISTNYSRIMWINAGDVHVFQSTVSQEKLHKFVQSF